MNRMHFFILGFAFIIAFILSSFYVSACIPDYSCKDWSSCSNGVQTRVCSDKSCGQPDILDRKLCASNLPDSSCTVKYSCDDWSSCTYYDQTNDIVSSQIKYTGLETRTCVDTNGCADGFSEERTCQDAFKVSFVKVEQCGMSFLVAQDINSKRPLAQVSLDAWRQQFLDISFIQSNFSYCPSCYNGFKDGDETGIDCGGSCSPCKPENNSYAPIVLSSWILAFGLFLTFLTTFLTDPDYVLRFVLYRAYVAIERGETQKLRKFSKKINRLYSKLSESQKAKYFKEVSRFRDKLSDFKIRASSETQ